MHHLCIISIVNTVLDFHGPVLRGFVYAANGTRLPCTTTDSDSNNNNNNNTTTKSDAGGNDKHSNSYCDASGYMAVPLTVCIFRNESGFTLVDVSSNDSKTLQEKECSFVIARIDELLGLTLEDQLVVEYNQQQQQQQQQGLPLRLNSQGELAVAVSSSNNTTTTWSITQMVAMALVNMKARAEAAAGRNISMAVIGVGSEYPCENNSLWLFFICLIMCNVSTFVHFPIQGIKISSDWL